MTTTCPTCGLDAHADAHPPGGQRCRTARLYTYAEYVHMARRIVGASVRGTAYALALSEPAVSADESSFVERFADIAYLEKRNARCTVPALYYDVPRYRTYEQALLALAPDDNPLLPLNPVTRGLSLKIGVPSARLTSSAATRSVPTP